MAEGVELRVLDLLDLLLNLLAVHCDLALPVAVGEDQLRQRCVESTLQSPCQHLSDAEVFDMLELGLLGNVAEIAHVHALDVKGFFKRG